jgi:biotin transport system substrate-specific component
MNNRKTIVRITLVALFAALIAAGTFIAIPVGSVPIVLQNLFALLAGMLLGPVLGGAAVGLYLVAGALGAPIFAGTVGGFGHFAAPSGGYLYGYLLSAVVAGLILGTPRPEKKNGPALVIAAVVLGLLVVYVPGLLWLKSSLNLPWTGAFAAGFVPFLIGDGIKGVVAVLITPRLRSVVADQLG